MEKENFSTDKCKKRRLRKLNVSVIYGEADLVECMEHVIRGKCSLKENVLGKKTDDSFGGVSAAQGSQP